MGAAGLAGCSADPIDPTDNGYTAPPVTFGVSIVEENSVYTRADEPGGNGTPGLDSIYIASSPWNQDFYIQLNTTDENGVAETAYGTYVVPSAYEGRLDSKIPSEALDWKSLNRDHTFYSWTVPWLESYTPSADTLGVYFYNSSEEKGYKENQNNAVYEGLIGAKSSSYAYSKHGKYVDLTFHHLVSKIRIESLILIQTDGSVQKQLQADMTFVGLPIKATFYPHPEADLPTEFKIPESGRPCVGGPYIDSPDDGVTYYIANVANVDDIFYICPEVDFSQIDYQIKLNSENYIHYDTYYGTFEEVEFVRNSGWGYDRGDDETGNDIDKKVLHAGEEMRLNIVLIPGVGPGLKVIIQDWSTDKPLESQYHSHAGFYSDAEIGELMNFLYDLNGDTYDKPSPELEQLFEMYGYEEDGKKYFPLYENLTVTKGNGVSNIFPVPPGYIIDGMGHTVTLKTNWGNYWGDGIASNYFNVGGIVRDIYFADESGNNMIYIDKNGFVWVTDEETGMLVITENQLPETVPDGFRGFDISTKTGKIRNTTYFNDHLGS